MILNNFRNTLPPHHPIRLKGYIENNRASQGMFMGVLIKTIPVPFIHKHKTKDYDLIKLK